MSSTEPVCPRALAEVGHEVLFSSGVGAGREAAGLIGCDRRHCDGPQRKPYELFGYQLPIGRMVCGQTIEPQTASVIEIE